MIAKEVDEKRKNKRFRVRDGAFVVLRKGTGIVGVLLDISSGGLAFKYIEEEAALDGFSDLDIFLRGSRFLWKGVPHKTVSDVEMDRDIPFSSVKTRRRGIEFEGLPHNQTSHLEYLMENHVMHDL